MNETYRDSYPPEDMYSVRWPDGDTYADANGRTSFTRLVAQQIAGAIGGRITRERTS